VIYGFRVVYAVGVVYGVVSLVEGCGIVGGIGLGSNEFGSFGSELDEGLDDFRAGASLALHLELYEAFHPERRIKDFLDAMPAASFGWLGMVICPEVIGEVIVRIIGHVVW